MVSPIRIGKRDDMHVLHCAIHKTTSIKSKNHHGGAEYKISVSEVSESEISSTALRIQVDSKYQVILFSFYFFLSTN